MVKWTTTDGDMSTYTYDGRSNRLVSTVNGRESGYETNNVNQYISFNQTDHFSYDLNGNLVRKFSRGRNETFVFDAEMKLIQTEVSPGKVYVTIKHTYNYMCSESLLFKTCIDVGITTML